MKRTIVLLIAVLLLMGVSACGSKAIKDPGLENIDSALMKLLSSEENKALSLDENYVSNIIKLGKEEYAGMSCRKSSAGLSMDEWGIFKAENESACKNLEKKLDAYLKARIESWMPEYLPEEFPKIQKSELYKAGNYVIYMILGEESKGAVKAELDSLFK